MAESVVSTVAVSTAVTVGGGESVAKRSVGGGDDGGVGVVSGSVGSGSVGSWGMSVVSGGGVDGRCVRSVDSRGVRSVGGVGHLVSVRVRCG